MIGGSREFARGLRRSCGWLFEALPFEDGRFFPLPTRLPTTSKRFSGCSRRPRSATARQVDLRPPEWAAYVPRIDEHEGFCIRFAFMLDASEYYFHETFWDDGKEDGTRSRGGGSRLRTSSVVYGECFALQREIGRTCAAGALPADSLRLECYPRDRVFTRRPNILWLPVRRLSLIPNYPKDQAARLCRDLYTDFRELPLGTWWILRCSGAAGA